MPAGNKPGRFSDYTSSTVFALAPGGGFMVFPAVGVILGGLLIFLILELLE